jgi:hypothetical protein
MPEFHHYTFTDDEQIIFGPARRAREMMLGVNRDEAPGEITHTHMRKIAVTNQRIVIEKPDACITIPNKDVQLITIQRNAEDRETLSSFTILEAKSRNGQKVRLLIPGISAEKIDLLHTTFPNARVDDQKGMISRFLRWLG